MTTYPYRVHLHRPHINPWLVVVALAAALVGLGSWVIVDQTTSATVSANPPRGLASARVAAMIEQRLALMNKGTDWKAFTALYTKSAVLEERDVTPPVITKGATQIAEHQRGYWQMGMRLKAENPIIQYRRLAEGDRSGSTESVGAGARSEAPTFLNTTLLPAN